ncbi:MAG: GLUG motif-containing protein [Thermoplasmatota archaeon]
MALLTASSATISGYSDEARTDRDGSGPPTRSYYGGGNGSDEDPYQISNLTDLQNIENNLSAHFILMNDIDASETRFWDQGGFQPIGSSDLPFTGSLYGAGHIIFNIWIDQRDAYEVGIFSCLRSAEIRNLSIYKAEVKGKSTVGVLAGRAEDSRIENCSVSGRITNTTGSAGGLLGFCLGDGLYVSNCSSDIQIDASSADNMANIGGLMGYKGSGKLENCEFTGGIVLNGSGYSVFQSIGGLIGQNIGLVLNSTSTGTLEINVSVSASEIGGLIGSNSGEVINCQYKGTIDIINTTTNTISSTNIGGLLGKNIGSVDSSSSEGSLQLRGAGINIGGLSGSNTGSISNSISITPILMAGRSFSNIGGLVGLNENGPISDCISASSIEIDTSTGNAIGIGGLVGYLNRGSISGSSSTCDISASGPSVGYIGGLAGVSEYGRIEDVFSTGNIKVFIDSTIASKIGGLVGFNDYGILTDGYFTGTIFINGTGEISEVGGLIGANYYPVSNIHATASIEIYATTTTTQGVHSIGGLIGYNHNSNVETAYSEGVIIFDLAGSVPNNQLTRLGGLVGYNFGGFISRAYSKVDIYKKPGTQNKKQYSPMNIGGLIGYNSGSILHSYSTGMISINDSKDADNIGGLNGLNDGSISDCYAEVSIYYTLANNHGYIGGMVGNNYGLGEATITNSYAVFDPKGFDFKNVGGVIGNNLGSSSGCFFDETIYPEGEAIAIGNTSGAYANSTTKMQKKETFLNEGWDFVNSWGIIQNVTYPWLYPLYHAPEIEVEKPDHASQDTEYIVDYWLVYSTYPSVNHLYAPEHETKAGWIHHDKIAHRINGTPRNDDVGSYWLNLSVKDYVGELGKVDIQIVVENVNDPPMIVTENILTVREDEIYSRYYYAIDIDPILTELKWVMLTDAQWLEFDGNHLHGRPSRYDIGEYWVNVSVFDLEGDYGSTNFTLTVESANDAPMITIDPVNIAIEDEPYALNLTAEDEDLNDELTWTLLSGPSWLLITRTQIRGIPGNDDVGTSWVRLRVTDLENASDELEFILEVKNTNDAPYWVETPGDQRINEGKKLILNIFAEDVDIGDRIFYNITSIPAADISIHPRTGVIEWDDPSPGTYTLNASANDGTAWTYLELTIVVEQEDQNIFEGNVPYIIAIVILVLLLLAVLMVFFAKNRKGEDGIEE